ILVATSLIEVGLDVPNASVIIIEAAERYGLATLHQLRGRVGRSDQQSYCYLFSSDDSAGSARLAAMERTNDGFRLAQIDIELRGAGQIYGLKQHGRIDLRFADLGDAKLVALVRQAAEAFAADPVKMVESKRAVARINQLKEVTSLD
ncbi:MAG TPA: helicase-related protein, partial [Candidatus Saccharimonadales bacterium]|nr:helicase-related protein [Candidatus Saccharimonadales bacterium]